MSTPHDPSVPFAKKANRLRVVPAPVPPVHALEVPPDPDSTPVDRRDVSRRAWAAAMRREQGRHTPRQQAPWAAASLLYPLIKDDGWWSVEEKIIIATLGCSRSTWYRYLKAWQDGGYVRQLVKGASAGDGLPGRQSVYRCTVPG